MIILSAGISQAATCTHYASPTGSASWANATDINTPTSAKTAFANALADNVVCFRGGTYNVGQDDGSGYYGSLNPSHSGTPGHPITFQAYPGETPILNGDNSNNAPDGIDRVLATGDGAVSWITYDGFVVQANGGTQHASIIVGGSGDPGGTGFVVKNCVINGGTQGYVTNDNRDGLRINNATNVTITNNKVYGFYWASGQTDDYACIKQYHGTNVTITNNELYNCNTGISTKRYSDDVTIAYNYIHDTKTGILANVNTGYAYDYHRWHIHNNVINLTMSGADNAIAIDSDNGPQLAYDFEVYNNTIRNVNGGCISIANAPRIVLYNNICSTAGTKFTTVRNTSTLTEADYNQWGTGTFSIKVHVYGTESDYSTLAGWKSSGQLNGGGNPGVGDLASNPLFTNGSGNFSHLSDFNLQPSSPCKGAGKNGTDIGATIFLKIPNAPNNLR
jgi:hypothetical protein